MIEIGKGWKIFPKFLEYKIPMESVHLQRMDKSKVNVAFPSSSINNPKTYLKRRVVFGGCGPGSSVGLATDYGRNFNRSLRYSYFPPTWPDLATLEGSSCTDIMTCTGGCGYSF